jgi:hypothetical protein
MIDEGAEPRLAGAQLVFRTFALRIVDQRPQNAGDAAELDATAMDFDGKYGAVLAQSVELVAKMFDFAVQAPAHVLRHDLTVLGGREIERAKVIDDLLHRVAEHLRKGRVHIRETVHVRHVNTGQRRFRQHAESLLHFGQLILGLLPLRNVLENAELAHCTIRRVTRYVALAVDRADGAIGPNHPVFQVVARTATHRCGSLRRRDFHPILGMDQFRESVRPVREAYGLDAEDPLNFTRQCHGVVHEIVFPPADVRHRLRRFELAFAVTEAAQQGQARERIAEPPAHFLEQALLRCAPLARPGALVQCEKIVLFGLRIDRHRDLRLDLELLRELPWNLAIATRT